MNNEVDLKFWEREAINNPSKLSGMMTKTKYLKEFRIHNEEKVFDSIINVKGKRVLEIGCGAGRWSRRMSLTAKEITAIDFSPEMIKIAKSYSQYKINYVCKRADKYKDNNVYDIIYFSCV